MKSYNQFCPVAKAAELFCERWTALIIRELIMGRARFSDIQRGVPLMSPTLLSKRLKELAAEGIIERHRDEARSTWTYQLTEAGREFVPIVMSLGVWGQRWSRRELAEHEKDLGLLLWALEKGAKPESLGKDRRIVEFELTDQPQHIRVTCPEPIVYRIMKSALLDRFYARYPNLRVEFVMSDQYIDLARGDADVALRSGDTDDDVLVGRKIADSLWSVYASKSYIDQHGRPGAISDLRHHAIVGFDGPMAANRAAKWMHEVAPDAAIAARITSVLGLVSVAKSGVAVVPMPIALGEAEPELVRLFEVVPELTRSWRILAHPDRRRTPAVAAFFEFIVDEIPALSPILTR